MAFDHPMIDNAMSFFGGSYDRNIIRKNNVESCQQNNQSFYFDTSGRIVRSVFTSNGDTQVYLFSYDGRGDLIETEVSGSKFPKTIITNSFKTYENGLLVKDSSSSGYFCKHLEYYQNGSLRQELWFGLHHWLQRAFWFGIDSLGRITRIIDRDYMGSSDSTGQLLSNRTLSYNTNGQLIREEEAVTTVKTNVKTLFCPNGGSATFFYDSYGKLIEIVRTKGPSQKVRYLENGLIEEIESKGKNCEGTAYHWTWKYVYTYRK